MSTRYSDITKNCMFLQLSMSRLGDKRGVSSDDIEVDADKDLVMVRKKLFKADQFNSIKTFDRQTKQHVKDIGFPYEKGFYLFPAVASDDLDEYLKERAKKREEVLVPAFAEIVPSLVDQTPKSLRALWKEEDYKKFTPEGVTWEFSMSWLWMMFTAPMQLEGVSTEFAKRAARNWDQRLERAYEETRHMLREVFLGIITKLRDNLEPDAYGGHKRLSTSAIRDLREFIANCPIRNVTDDRQIAQWSAQVEKLIGDDTEAFRENDGFRARVHGELTGIEKAISDSIEVAPKRRIKLAS